MVSTITLVVLTVIITHTATFAQQKASNWSAMGKPKKVFIENKSQFDGMNNLPNSQVLYATDYGAEQFLFTKNGLTIRLTEKILPGKEERQRREREMKAEILAGKNISHKEMEEEEHRISIRKDFVQMTWLNANPNVQVIATQPVSHYYNYQKGNSSIDGAKAFEKVVYKNLYPNIDVEYVFHEQEGIEYNFILHPGADASKIKMSYSDVSAVNVDATGNIHLPTLFGDIVEHAPKTFYADKSPIDSRFVAAGKVVTFNLAAYDNTREVVIDPWIKTPGFPNTQWDCVWECEKDGAGNVYIIGGTSNMQLLKYDAAGNPLWTYNTPYDTSSWLGTFATDNAGNSYVTLGSTAAIQKINTSGTLVWNNGNPGGIFASTEFWSISFNCDETRLVIGGTGNTLPPQPYIYQVDMATGNVTNSVRVTGGALFPTQEVRSITACGNGKYYFLTHDSIGYINQNFSACSNSQAAIFYANNGYGLGYKCENWRYNNTGVEAIKTYGNFVFVHRGNRLDKRNFSTGALISSVAIPGGAFTTQLGSSFVENSGLDIDNCGNIYVGSKNQVVKFDQNLTQLGVYATTQNYNVYDVQVSTNGDIIACGSTGTSSSGARTGYVESFAVSACAPIAITCCDASICEIGPFCTTDAPVSLTAGGPGPSWSGPGVSNGTFSPSVAGQGLHYVRNTIACGSDSIPVTVNLCAALSVCSNPNGSLTVSNGTNPYTWYQQTSSQSCASCVVPALCFPPGCETTVNTWTSFGTGATVTPPGTYPIKVSDNSGNELVIASLASLPSCSACALTATTSTNPAGCTATGSATANVTAGTGPYSYLWSNGATTATASNLAAGSYTVTVTGANNCTGTASATVSSNASTPTLSTSSTAAGCSPTGSATVSVTAGTGPYTYLWSNGAGTATASNLSGGNYTVTVTGAGGCSTTASVNVASNSGISLSSSSNTTTCGQANGSASVSVTAGTGPYSYLWSNGGTGSSLSSVAAGSYTVTVTGAGNCSATVSVSVPASQAISVSVNTTQPGCNSTGSASATVNTGNGPFTYLWNNGGTTATINNLAPGTFTVTVTGANNCTGTQSATLTSGSASLNATFTVSQPSCGQNNGTLTCLGVTGGTQPYNITWTNNGQSLGSSLSIANLDSGVYFFSASDQNGCDYDTSFTLNPSGAGSVTINSNTNQMCSGDSALICAPAGYTSYLWNTGGNTQCISTKLAGNYRVTVTDAGGCTATSPNIGISVFPLPPVSVSVNGNVLSSFNAVSYQWYFNGNLIPGATSSTYTATSSGAYYVVVTDANGCKATSNSVELSVTGIESLSYDDFTIFPNPVTNGNWNLMTGKAWLGAKVKVYNAAGQLVFETEVKDNKTEIGFDAAQGMYMLEMKLNRKKVEEKLIKL